MWPVAVPNQLFNFTHTLLKKFSRRGYIKNEINAHCNNREKKLTSWLRLLKSKFWIINYLYCGKNIQHTKSSIVKFQ